MRARTPPDDVEDTPKSLYSIEVVACLSIAVIKEKDEEISSVHDLGERSNAKLNQAPVNCEQCCTVPFSFQI